MTSLVKEVDLRQWFATNVRDVLAINPVSISPQPVHALSSFMHRVTEVQGPRRLAEVARLVAMKDGLWALSNSEIRDITRLPLPDTDAELEQLRHALAGLLAADRAVFKSPYSFQVAHAGMASNDRTDNGLGDLGAHLLLASDAGPAAVVAMLDRLFERQHNPHWAISSLLVETTRRDMSVAAPLSPLPWMQSAACESFGRECQSLLLRAINLVATGHDTLMSLRVLATTLTWLGLQVYAQVPSLVTAGQLAPMLAEAGEPGQLPGLRDSSASSRRALNGTWEAWLTDLLTDEVTDRFGGTEPVDRDMIDFLKRTEPYGLSGGSQLAKSRIETLYGTWRSHHDPFDAAGHTLQDILGASMGNKPQKWFDSVGRHCGFVGPRRGHPARFRAEVSLLPTLVIAGMDELDPPALPMSEWLDRLISRFGVVFGPHPFARAMPDRAPEEELERNRDLLSKLLAAVGLARRYSDGVTEVLNINNLWVESR